MRRCRWCRDSSEPGSTGSTTAMASLIAARTTLPPTCEGWGTCRSALLLLLLLLLLSLCVHTAGR
jgi:hypothetical protein